MDEQVLRKVPYSKDYLVARCAEIFDEDGKQLPEPIHLDASERAALVALIETIAGRYFMVPAKRHDSEAWLCGALQMLVDLEEKREEKRDALEREMSGLQREIDESIAAARSTIVDNRRGHRDSLKSSENDDEQARANMMKARNEAFRKGSK